MALSRLSIYPTPVPLRRSFDSAFSIGNQGPVGDAVAGAEHCGGRSTNARRASEAISASCTEQSAGETSHGPNLSSSGLDAAGGCGIQPRGAAPQPEVAIGSTQPALASHAAPASPVDSGRASFRRPLPPRPQTARLSPRRRARDGRGSREEYRRGGWPRLATLDCDLVCRVRIVDGHRAGGHPATH